MQALASPALLRATQIKLEIGKVTPLQAATVFDGLRYRWRGDATELETIRALGQLYLSQGRYREALEALRSAGSRLPDLPEALQLRSDLNVAFRSLFLDGNTDGLEPVQALALFEDFKELAPIGSDGDLMVRKLVRRLVDVDLLDQAAELLKYQADYRLDGVARAQVATDLARIYLMDRKPEKAIEAINGSRTAGSRQTGWGGTTGGGKGAKRNARAVGLKKKGPPSGPPPPPGEPETRGPPPPAPAKPAGPAKQAQAAPATAAAKG